MVGASARGAAAIGMGPRVVRARRTRVNELHASGGMPGWRAWPCRSFRDYNRLANAF
jgi:hypothetical protein